MWFELCIFEFPPNGSSCVFSSYVFSSFHKLSEFFTQRISAKNSYSRRFHGFPAGSLQLSSTVSYYANLVVRVVYFRVPTRWFELYIFELCIFELNINLNLLYLLLDFIKHNRLIPSV